MNSNTMQMQSVEALQGFKSSTWERLTNRVSREASCELVFIALTISLMTFLAYTFYQGLQNYQVF